MTEEYCNNMKMSLNKARITEISKFLLNIINIMKKKPDMEKGPEHQTFYRYLEEISLMSITKQVRYLSSLVNSQYIADYSNILEVGSGYGLNLAILKTLRFKKVVGVENEKSIFKNSEYFLELIRESNPPFSMDNCSVVLGDAQKTNFENSEFRNVICIEAISHFPSRDQSLREMNRLLDLNGVLLISDGNNLANIFYKRKLLKQWDYLRKRELLKRLNFVKHNWPQLNAQYQATLAIHTELLSLAEIKNTIPIILSTNKLPMNLYFEGYAPTYAETGIWAEWGFSPKKLKLELSKYGFEVFLQANYGRARGFPFSYLTSAVNYCFPLCLKFILSRAIIAYCIKKESCNYLIY